MQFQDLVGALHAFWKGHGCWIAEPYDIEKGAGTMNPQTFFRALGRRPWRVGYMEPSRRPADGRYGENPNRLSHFYQYQVLLKPAPDDIQDMYLESLRAIGLDPTVHDIRFVEDNWEAPTQGAWGLGWEVWCDGMEITQFTYFQQMAGFELPSVPVEITYGTERIAAYLQGKDSVFDVQMAPGLTYGDVFLPPEAQQSRYAFELSDAALLTAWFDGYEKEAQKALAAGLWVVGYDFTLKCSHTFNLLDARGAISHSERAAYVARVRALSRKAAELYLQDQEPDGEVQA